MLVPFQSKTTGQVYKELFEPRGWDRRRYDGIVWDLESQGLVFQAKHTFVKNGESIDFGVFEAKAAKNNSNLIIKWATFIWAR